MSAEPAAVCAACGTARPLGWLLRVTDRRTGATRHVCRPSYADKDPATRDFLVARTPCFGSVRSRVEEAIELAYDAPARRQGALRGAALADIAGRLARGQVPA